MHARWYHHQGHQRTGTRRICFGGYQGHQSQLRHKIGYWHFDTLSRNFESHFPAFVSANTLKGQIHVFTVQRPLNGARNRLQRPMKTVAFTVQRSLNGKRYLYPVSWLIAARFPAVVINRSAASLLIVPRYHY